MKKKIISLSLHLVIFFGTLLSHTLLNAYYYAHDGICLSCNKATAFIARNEWHRDHYLCQQCGSIPRERALMYIIKKNYPNFLDLHIHESSPAFRSTSAFLKNNCPHYSYSYYVEGIPSGDYLKKYNCLNQDLGATSYPNESFDLVITQDVMEHIFNIESLFIEIARILKVGGSHVFTTPIVYKNNPTVVRAIVDQGKLIHIHPPVYHGNPIDATGSLVTYDFGYDMAKFTPKNCYFTIYHIENASLGLEKTEYNEVCVMTKIHN